MLYSIVRLVRKANKLRTVPNAVLTCLEHLNGPRVTLTLVFLGTRYQLETPFRFDELITKPVIVFERCEFRAFTYWTLNWIALGTPLTSDNTFVCGAPQWQKGQISLYAEWTFLLAVQCVAHSIKKSEKLQLKNASVLLLRRRSWLKVIMVINNQ